MSRISWRETLNAEEDSYFEKVLKHLYNTIFKFSKNKQGHCVFTLSEGGIAEKMGMTTDSLLNKHVLEVFPPAIASVVEIACQEAFDGAKTFFEIQLFNRYFLVYLSPIDENGQIKEVIGTAIDITERKIAENKVKEMAFHDSLTKLPNRRLLEQYVKTLIDSEGNQSFSLLFIDVDRFKHINDTFGHSFGDKLLVAIAARIKELLKSSDFLFRQGGDEFIILLPNQNREQVVKLVENILESMENHFVIEGVDIFTSISIGASMYPNDGDRVDVLMKHADAAMYFAKRNGENKFEFYRENVDMNLREKFIIETELRKAIQQNQLELFYQPKVEIHTEKILGFEALVRWKHPQLGYISPSKFIPVAEETELIIPIGNWVLETACKQLKDWYDKGFTHLTMSVNVSQLQFTQTNLIEVIQNILSECDMSSESLELEMTESIMGLSESRKDTKSIK